MLLSNDNIHFKGLKMYNLPSGSQIKTLRIKLGLTHKEVSKLTGVCTAHISRLENNKNVSYWIAKNVIELYLELSK